MLFKRPQLGLPQETIVRFKLFFGLSLLIFFLSIQPFITITNFPPKVKAEQFQTQEIGVSSLPFPFQVPHPGYISTKFSVIHPGVDIASGLGMSIHPIARGKVIDEGFNIWGLGLVVTIDHGEGFRSLYGHMGKIYVHKGQEVTDSTILGTVGLTGNTSGPHTHLEVFKDGKQINPLLILPRLSEIPNINE